MLSIRFFPKNKPWHDEVEVDAPYQVVGDYLTSDVQHDPEGAQKLIATFKQIIRGERELFEDEGNAYLVEVNASAARISTEYGTKPSCELPTAWLIDALEQWVAYLEGRRTT